MKSFLERLKNITKKYPNRIVLRSKAYSKGITYKQLDDASNRICGFLKNRNIGKEDFVMILMPREASAYISVIGVWKSGAAMILLEEDYSAERVNYIKSDLNCKFVITKEAFDEIMKYDSCESYDLPALTDACYATYTSGSTGKPKGILHEFGKLDTFDYDYNNKLLPLDENKNFAIITPLNFGPSIRNAVTSLLYGKCLYIVPRNIVKNPKLLLKYFNENKISETSVTCSFFKEYCFASKYMKNVFVHSEPCTKVFEKGVNVINLYTLSEVVFPIFTFPIDKAYENAPLGYSNENFEIKIVNENSEEAKPNEVGEIIVFDAYTRGYINLPKTTAEAFSNGYFHTGDLGYYNESGMVFLSGRKDDMIKINGNRIEPMEIEVNIKKSLRINNVIAKGFSDEKRSFVVAYFIKDELSKKKFLNSENNLIFTASEMKNKLQNMLPDYMIPSYYVVLDEFPKEKTGKLSRKRLPKPIADDYLKNYECPKNEIEAYFCKLFEKVLMLDRVGVNDDFYQISGDSLSSMKAIAECDRFELSIADLYNERTPKNLASVFAANNKKTDYEDMVSISQPLLSEQQAIFEGQMQFPDMILNNLIRFYKLYDEINIEKYRCAVNKALKNHPVFYSVLVNDNKTEKICQKPELFKEISVVKISPEELKKLKEEKLKPFEMENKLLYRCFIYECENRYYFYLEIHHIISDGTSLKMLFDEIGRYYYDINYTSPKDNYYLLLQKNAKKSNISREIGNLYHLNAFKKRKYNTINLDDELTNHIPAIYERILNVDRVKIRNNKNFKKYKENIFFLTCFLKTIADYNNANKAFTFWIFNGREEKYLLNTHGLLIRTMPMGIDFDNVNNAFDYVKNETVNQITSETDFINNVTDEFMLSPYFVYQKNILSDKSYDVLYEEEIKTIGGCMVFEFHLTDNDEQNNYGVVIKYSSKLYKRKSIEKFCELFEKNLKEN